MVITRLFTIMAFAASVLLSRGLLVTAQDEEIDTDSLLTITLDAGALPAPPAFLRLAQITLDPGAISPAHTHPGPEFGYVTSGVITVNVTGPAKIKQRSAKEADPFEDAKQDKDIQLDRGDQISYPAGTTLTFSNKSDKSASILALVVLPGAGDRPPLIDYVAEDPAEKAFEGLTSRILGDGILTTLPSGPSEITIRRVKLNEGQSLPGTRNPVLYSVVKGACDFMVTAGSVQITRAREPGPATDTGLDEKLELKPGDAMFFPNGVRTTVRGENSDDLELLQVIVAPDSRERLAEDNRGQIRFNQLSSPPEADAEDQADTSGSGASSPQLEEGSSAYVNSTDVNLRDAPSISGGLVTVLIYGQEMIVDGEPVDADGVVWLPVRIADDDTIAGYVSTEFLQAEPVE